MIRTLRNHVNSYPILLTIIRCDLLSSYMLLEDAEPEDLKRSVQEQCQDILPANVYPCSAERVYIHEIGGVMVLSDHLWKHLNEREPYIVGATHTGEVCAFCLYLTSLVYHSVPYSVPRWMYSFPSLSNEENAKGPFETDCLSPKRLENLQQAPRVTKSSECHALLIILKLYRILLYCYSMRVSGISRNKVVCDRGFGMDISVSDFGWLVIYSPTSTRNGKYVCSKHRCQVYESFCFSVVE
mmetsp:Transcript_10237/g.18612  ORF Transcript_10237/g.18612 Transcript_10237/m.18612 type:complete len:241 (+) Transcript_10237:575-1297(+)